MGSLAEPAAALPLPAQDRQEEERDRVSGYLGGEWVTQADLVKLAEQSDLKYLTIAPEVSRAMTTIISTIKAIRFAGNIKQWLLNDGLR